MCRPSCCTSSSRNSGGTGLAVIAILIAAAIVAAKIGPAIAEIGRVVARCRSASPCITAGSALVLAAAIWLAVRLCRRYSHLRGPAAAAAAHTSRAHDRIRTGQRAVLPRLRGQGPRHPRHRQQRRTGPAMPGMPARPAGEVTAMPAASPRNHRNNPYIIDRAMVTVHHSTAGALWRFRTEALALTAAIATAWELTLAMTAHRGRSSSLAASTAVIGVLPWTRRLVIRRAWCVLSRHRIQRVCYETRMHTRSGRLPLVLRIHPTEVGERALIWCRAGICAEDFEAHSARSLPPATPVRPASKGPSGGRSSSPSTSCAATPSPRTTSSPPACTTAGPRNGSHPPPDARHSGTPSSITEVIMS